MSSPVLGYPKSSIVVSGLYSNVNADPVKVHQEITTGLASAEFKCQHTLYPSIDVGNTVNIYIMRSDDSSFTQIFHGYITEKEMIEEGHRPKEISVQCQEFPWIFNRYVTYSSIETSESVAITTMIAPLVNDGLITATSISSALTTTVVLEDSTEQEIFGLLSQFCRDHTIEFWLDYNTPPNFHAVRASALPTSTLSLDQTNSLNPRIFTSTYVKDATQIKNTIVVYGGCNSLHPGGSIDHWTDSTVGWTCDYYNDDTALSYPASIELADPLTYVKSIHVFKQMSNQGQQSISIVRATLNFGETVHLTFGGQMIFDLLAYAHPGMYALNQYSGGIFTIYMFDNNNNFVIQTIPIETPTIQNVTLSTDLFGTFNVSGTYDPTYCTSIVFAWASYQQSSGSVPPIGYRCWWSGFYLDKLYFMEYVRSTFSDVTSVSSYGKREAVSCSVDAAYTQPYLDQYARYQLSPYTAPVTSPQNVKTEGYKGFKAGERIYVRTDLYNSTFTMRAVDFLVDGLNFINDITFSQSEQYEPVMSREKLESLNNKKITDHERRLRFIEGGGIPSKRSYYDYGNLLSKLPTPFTGGTIYFGTLTGTINCDSIKVTNIDASYINAGTIDADLIDVINLNADNITAGTINAESIGVINLNASNITTGTLDAGVLSATVAYISGTAQIATGIITDLHIVNNVITWDKMDYTADWASWGNKEHVVTSFESLLGFDISGTSGSGSWEARKNDFRLFTGTDSEVGSYLKGYRILNSTFSPKFKSRIEIGSSGHHEAYIGMKNATETDYMGYMITDLESGTLRLRADTWTWNSGNYYRIADSTFSDSNEYGYHTITNTLGTSVALVIGKVSTVPATLYLGTIYMSATAGESTIEGSISINQFTINNKDIITCGLWTFSGASQYLHCTFSSALMIPCTVPAATWSGYVKCSLSSTSINPHTVRVGWGYQSYSRIFVDTPIILAIASGLVQRKYWCGFEGSNFHKVLECRYNNDDTNVVFNMRNEDYFTISPCSINSDLTELFAYIVNGTDATNNTLTLHHWSAQEDWMT